MGTLDEETKFEKGSRLPPKKSSALTLQDAVEMGEYDPSFLSTFAEWHTLSRHVQFQYIRRALDNRHRHLVTQWAEIFNMLDFSKKPELSYALKNIQEQIKKLDKDRERLYIEYSKL